MGNRLQLSRVIGEIYEGVFDPDRWHRAMRNFLELSGGRTAFLGIIDSARGTLPLTSMVGPETSAMQQAMDTHRELIPIDPGLPYALARPEGGNFRFSETSELLTDEPELWRNFIRHDFGSGDYHSRFSAERDGISLVLALHTSSAQEVLTPEQEEMHAILFDHFERAVRIAYRMPDTALAGHPVLVLDSVCRIVKLNEEAEELLARDDGLIGRNGEFRLNCPAEHEQLARTAYRICLGEHGERAEHQLAGHRPSGLPPYLLKLSPLPLAYPAFGGQLFRCMVEIRAIESKTVTDPRLLVSMFGLTPREAEVASLFTSSCSDLPSIARELGIGYETARSHLRAILGKTGLANQLELARLLARLN